MVTAWCASGRTYRLALVPGTVNSPASSGRALTGARCYATAALVPARTPSGGPQRGTPWPTQWRGPGLPSAAPFELVLVVVACQPTPPPAGGLRGTCRCEGTVFPPGVLRCLTNLPPLFGTLWSLGVSFRTLEAGSFGTVKFGAQDFQRHCRGLLGGLFRLAPKGMWVLPAILAH